MSHFRISSHTNYDKSFDITGPLRLTVDNDDVDTAAVDVLVEQVVKVLNEHWTPIIMRRCEVEDCETAWSKWYPREWTLCPDCGTAMPEHEVTS